MHAVCGQRRARRIVSWPSGSGPLRQQSSVGLYLEFRAMGDQRFTGASYPSPIHIQVCKIVVWYFLSVCGDMMSLRTLTSDCDKS